jgi:hypothetical protein
MRGREQLRVVESHRWFSKRRQHDRTYAHRSRERATANLINADDDFALIEQTSLELK